MEDLVKKFIYTGVGLVALTAEKVQEVVDDLVNDGKLSKDEGKKIVDDLVDNTDNKREEFEDKFRSFTEGLIERFNFPTRTEMEELTKRIESLEAKLEAKKAAPKTPAKRSAPKKSSEDKK